MDWREHIVSDPLTMVGKPVVKDTRLTVEHLIDQLALPISLRFLWT